MAQIILGTNETFTVGANSTATVVGGSGTEKVIVAAGSVVTADQSVERTELSGKSSDYTYSISGNVITVKSGTTTVATLTGGNGDKTIAFADGSATLALTGLNAATLGNQAISTTGSTLTPALNTADKSTAGTSGTTNGGSTSTTGSTFTLTSSGDGDNISGTSANEIFNAPTVGRLQSVDIIDGGAGDDTLTAKLNAAVIPSINAVETINIEALNASAGLDGSSVTGAKYINVSGGGTLTVTNAAKNLAFSLADDDTSLIIDPAGSGTADDNAVTVDLKSGKLGTLSVAGGSANGADDFDQITLNASGAASVTLTALGASAGTFVGTDEKIVVNGSSDLVLTIADAELGASTSGASSAATIDASAHTAKLTLALGALDSTNVETGFSKMTGIDAVSASLNGTNLFVGLASGTEVIVTAAAATSNDLSVATTGTASTDSVTVTLNNPTKGANSTFDDLTTTSFENVTVNSTGTDSTSTVVTNALGQVITTTANSTLTIGGDKFLTVQTSVTGIDNDFTKVTVTNTEGVDLTFDATSTITVTGGAGNDRFEFDTKSELSAGDSIDGGTGTNTLAISAVIGADLTTAQLGYVKNFQKLEYVATQTLAAAATADLTKLGATSLFLNGVLTTTSSYTLTATLPNNGTVKMGGSLTNGGTASGELIFAVSGADAAGANSDNLKLELVNFDDSTGSSSDTKANGGFTVSDVEKVTISLLGDEAAAASNDNADTYVLASIVDSSLNTIVINSANTGKTASGTLKVSDSLTITDATSTIISTVDASSFTGTLTITGLNDNYIATGANIKGGSGVNNITGGTGADLIIGGKSADVLIGDGGKDNISGGSGADNITGGTGADVLTGGAGRDAFIGAVSTDTDSLVNDSTLTSYDVIKDFQLSTKAISSANAGTSASAFIGSSADFGAEVDLLTVGLKKDDGAGTAGAAVTQLVTADVVLASAIDIASAYNTESGASLTALKVYVKNGIMSLTGADASSIDTVAEWVDVAKVLLQSTTSTVDTVAGFKLSGSTYVYFGIEETAGADVITGESLVQLENIEATGIKLIGSSVTADVGTVFIL